MAGGLIVLIGLIWLLQGIGLLPGSFMTGNVLWAAIGAGCIVLGLVLTVAGGRGRRRRGGS